YGERSGCDGSQLCSRFRLGVSWQGTATLLKSFGMARNSRSGGFRTLRAVGTPIWPPPWGGKAGPRGPQDEATEGCKEPEEVVRAPRVSEVAVAEAPLG